MRTRRATCADAGGRGNALGEAGEVSLILPSFYTETRVPLFYNSALAVASIRAGLLVLERSSRVDYCAPAPRRIFFFETET